MLKCCGDTKLAGIAVKREDQDIILEKQIDAEDLNYRNRMKNNGTNGTSYTLLARISSFSI